MARRPRRRLVLIAGAAIGSLAALYFLDAHAFQIGLGAVLAAGAAYLLMGPAMTTALKLLSAWMSS